VEIRHLRYFIAVAELRNFTRAAESTFVAQSALSQQIKRLEDELGGALFVRGRHGVDLTPIGEVLLPHARRAVADVDLALSEVRAHLGLEKGTLSLGLIQTGDSSGEVVGSLRRFNDGHPEIDIRVVGQTSAEMLAAVASGTLDLAFVGIAEAEVPEPLNGREVSVDPLVGVVPADAAGRTRGPVSIGQLLTHGRLISFKSGTGLRHLVDDALRRAGVKSGPEIELTQASDLLRFVAAGLGVTILPRGFVTRSLAEAGGDLAATTRIISLRDPAAVQPVTVVHDPSRVSAAGKAFLALLPSHK